MRSRLFFSVFFLLLLLLFPVGRSIRGSEVTGDGGNRSGHKRNLVLQFKWFHQFQFAGYYCAIEQGYYEKAGLQVTLKEGAPDLSPVDEVLSGRADFGVTDPSILIRFNQGAQIQVLAAIFQHSPAVIISLESSKIHSPGDLAGRKIMLASTVRAEFFAMCYQQGVDPLRATLSPPSWDISELITGKTDAFSGYITNEPYLLEEKNIPYTLLIPRNYEIDFYGDCLFSRQPTNPEQIAQARAFRDASIQGWRYAMKYPEETVALILEKYSRRKPSKHLLYEATAMKELMQTDLVEIGHMNHSRWKHIADSYVKVDMLPSNYSLNGFFMEEMPESEHLTLAQPGSLLVVFTLLAGIPACLLGALLYRNHLLLKERNRALAAYGETQRRCETELGQTLDSTEEGIIFTGEATLITRMNQRAEILTGWTKEDAAGLPLNAVFSILSPEPENPEASRISSPFDYPASGGHPWKGLLRQKNGNKLAVSCRVILRAPENESLGSILIFRDTSRECSLKEELRRSREMESKGRRAEEISQELRDLLNGITGSAEMILLKQRSESPVSTYCDSILDTAGRASVLLKQILPLSSHDRPKESESKNTR